MLAINSFYQEHIWSLWTLPDLTIKSRNSPPSAVLFSLNYFRQRLVASVPPPVWLTADCWCRAVPSCLRSALSRPAAAAAAQIFYNPCSSSAAAQILVPCSAAAQMLCLPCFCCCLHPDTLRCPTLLHLIYPTGNSFFEQRHSKPALQEVWVLNSSSEGGWVGGGLKFSFPQHFAMHSANKKKVVSLSIAQEYLKIVCSFLQ